MTFASAEVEKDWRTMILFTRLFVIDALDRSDGRGGVERRGMFERFTERASQVVVFAQEEARTAGSLCIGTEHLLLGLIREEHGVAADVLGTYVTLDAAREKIVDPEAEPGANRGDQIPFTTRARKVLELALREALSLGHNYVATEHILLGLLREGKGKAVEVLYGLGVHREALRTDVIRVLSVGATRGGGSVDKPPKGRPDEDADEMVVVAVTRELMAAIEERVLPADARFVRVPDEGVSIASYAVAVRPRGKNRPRA